MSSDFIARALAQRAIKAVGDTQGADAYEVAVAAGFVGTRNAWVASLKGPPGEGKDAYLLALEAGFVGDRNAWLLSLRGADGVGVPGKDAYEVAVAAGFVGDRAAWLASLQGADVDPAELSELQEQLQQALERIAVLESPDELSPLTLSADQVLETVEPGVLIGEVLGIHPYEVIEQLDDADGRLVYEQGRLYTGEVAFNYDVAQAHETELRRTLAKPGKPPIVVTATLSVDVVDVVTLTDLPLQDGEISFTTPEGAELADLGPLLQGEVRTIDPDDGRVVFNDDQTKLLRGLSGWTAGEVEFQIVRILEGATNSPHATLWRVRIGEALSVSGELTISGTPLQGEALSISSLPEFTGIGLDFAYEWSHLGHPDEVISDSSEGYRVATADVGKTIILTLYVTDFSGETAVVTSNALGPVVAKTYAQNYAFDEPAGTKLGAIGWHVSGGDDAFEATGAGAIRKVASVGQYGLYTKPQTVGARYQKVSGELISSVSSWFAVLSKWNGGIDGYLLRRSSSTSLRLQRARANSLTALTSSNAIAIPETAVQISLEAQVHAGFVTLKVWADGSVVWEGNDTAENRHQSGAAGLAYISTNSISQCYGSANVEAGDYIGGTGVVANVVVRHGRETVANNGSMPPALPSLGLLQSGEVGSWEFVKTSGNVNYPASVTSGLTPAPLVTLTDADAGSTTIYEVWADGVDTGRTFTIHVQPIVEPKPATSVASTSDVGRLNKAALGGKIVEIVDGCGDQLAKANPLEFSAFNGHAGYFEVRRQPASTKGIRRLRITGSSRISVQGLLIEDALPPWNGVPYPDDGTPAQSDMANSALLTISTSEDILVQRCTIGAPESMQFVPERWYSAISTNGSGLVSPSTGIIVGASSTDTDLSNGNTLRRCKDGFTIGNVTSSIYRGNSIQHFCSNAVFVSGARNADLDIFENIINSPWYNPADPKDHRDTMQIGGTSVRANYERIRIRMNKITLGVGNIVSQGLFPSDVAANGVFNGTGGNPLGVQLAGGDPTKPQYLTGYQFVDCEFSNNLYQIGHPGVAGIITLGTGWQYDNNTLMRARGQTIEFGGLGDPSWRESNFVEAVSGVNHRPSGDFRRNVSHGSAGVVGLTKAYNVDMPPSGLATVGKPSNEGWETFYGAYFGDPDEALPLIDGPLKCADGSYAGWKNPDGSWAGAPWAA